MEAIKSSPPEAEETHCPACNAAINTSSIGRRRRVQCPQCREVVELGAKKAPAAAITALRVAQVEEVRVPVSKIEALEARIAALEAAARASAPVSPIEIVVQRPERKWKWLAHSEAHDAEILPASVTETLLQNLRNFDGHTITIHANSGSARAVSLAASLKELFERASWTVEGPTKIVPRGSETGLFLAVGGLPLPPAAEAAYFAMTTSGFTLHSFLDPKLTGPETILIVA